MRILVAAFLTIATAIVLTAVEAYRMVRGYDDTKFYE